jgi:hypothetical protein
MQLQANMTCQCPEIIYGLKKCEHELSKEFTEQVPEVKLTKVFL